MTDILAILLSPDDQVIKQFTTPSFMPTIKMAKSPKVSRSFANTDPLMPPIETVTFIASLVESELASMANGRETVIYREAGTW